MIPARGLVEAILAAPLGVATLARLEWRATDAEMPGSEAPASTAAGVDAAVDLVHSMTLDEFFEVVVCWAGDDVGPWRSDAPFAAAVAYRDSEVRRPIAVAVAEAFGDDLERPVDRSAQQFWTTAIDPSADRLRPGGTDAPRLGDFARIYGSGQFTFGGLWTVTDPPPVLHEALVDVWEMYPGPIVRWRLPVRPDARVFELHGPDDWVRLVTEHPTPAAPGQEGWELPGPNQSSMLLTGANSSLPEPTSARDAPPESTGVGESLPESVRPVGQAHHLADPPPPPSVSGPVSAGYEPDTGGGWFRYSPGADRTWSAAGGWAPHPEGSVRSTPVEPLELSNQHAARGVIGRHLVPDWASVARGWDGVHLSWAGLVTTEGFVADLPDGDVAMLRYWFTERTLWLNDVFGEPEPLGEADVEAKTSNGVRTPGAIDLRTDIAAHDCERRRLDGFLGR